MEREEEMRGEGWFMTIATNPTIKNVTGNVEIAAFIKFASSRCQLAGLALGV